MKKILISQTIEAEKSPQREDSYFCEAADAETSDLRDIALRLIISDIPKQKPARGETPKTELVEPANQR